MGVEKSQRLTLPMPRRIALFTRGRISSIALRSGRLRFLYYDITRTVRRKDISICQQRYSKSILLSVGGVTYSEGGFRTASQAMYGADLLWATFGPQSPASQALRPFGPAMVDGFDLDFEMKVDNVLPFATRLRALMDADRARTGKQWLLTIAPQCPYPDQANNAMLNNEIYFDAVWVQYYNNVCGLQSFDSNSSTQDTFNFDTWNTWARHVSRNPSVKIFLGIPGAPGAASIGYRSTYELRPIFEYCKQFPSFGGVMVWDASQAYANVNFLPNIKLDLLNLDTATINGC